MSSPIRPRYVDWRWHVLALAVPATIGPCVMRGWFGDILPLGDFSAFAAEAAYVRDALLAHGRLPLWLSDRFAGTTWFLGCVKDLATFPLAWAFGTVLGTKLMFLVAKVAAAVAMYAIFARHLRAPAAGILAGAAYAFGSAANHQTALGGHLDVALLSVLFPLVFLAALEVLRGGRLLAAIALGTLVAAEFSLPDLHAQSLIVPVMVLLLVALRPWRESREAGDSLAELANRWRPLAAALAVFLLLAASPLAWLAADLRHHGLHGAAVVEEGLARFSELSPFMYLNRQNWLGPWLARHRPDGLILFGDPLFDERRYLGLVALALCAVGWLAVRRTYSLRRWYQTFALLFLVQYWLSTGPHTLVWQMGRSFGWPKSADVPLERALGLAALGVLACAVLGRNRPSVASRVSLELAVGIALPLVVASHSLFDLARRVLPVLAALRSPGHFFDLAPFAFFALVGVALAACARAVRGPALRVALGAGMAVLLWLDYRPSTAAFERGWPLEAMRQAERELARLPSEDGTLRVAMPRFYLPRATLVATTAHAGLAASGWKAGRHWAPFMDPALYWTSLDDGDERRRARAVGEVLMRIGRLRYVIDQEPSSLRLEPPWRRVLASDAFALWEQPEVEPMAAGYRAYVILSGGTPWAQAKAAVAAWRREALVVAAEDGRPDVPGPSASLDADATAFGAGWEALAGALPVLPRIPVAYRRLAPEHIVLEADAGAAPAVVVVSEAHHPWWRAAVDGSPAHVARAQLAFMAVGVGPGRHVVELRLARPLLVALADWVSRAAWAALAIVTVVFAAGSIRRRRAGGRSDTPA